VTDRAIYTDAIASNYRCLHAGGVGLKLLIVKRNLICNLDYSK
jgi:hypothetical protein